MVADRHFQGSNSRIFISSFSLKHQSRILKEKFLRLVSSVRQRPERTGTHCLGYFIERPILSLPALNDIKPLHSYSQRCTERLERLEEAHRLCEEEETCKERWSCSSEFCLCIWRQGDVQGPSPPP